VWADGVYWKALRENTTLLDDTEIRKRLNHMAAALARLTTRAKGKTPDPSDAQEIGPADELEAALAKANAELIEAINTLDLQKMVAVPRGPKGPWEAPAGVLLLQGIMHSQHHRGQNGARMRQLGATLPTTDFVIWYALGGP
jgi:uncharacterized damage-inducible protein DinB